MSSKNIIREYIKGMFNDGSYGGLKRVIEYFYDDIFNSYNKYPENDIQEIIKEINKVHGYEIFGSFDMVEENKIKKTISFWKLEENKEFGKYPIFMKSIKINKEKE